MKLLAVSYVNEVFFKQLGGTSRGHLTYEGERHVTRDSVTTKMAAAVKKQSDGVFIFFLFFLFGSCQSFFRGAEMFKRQVRRNQTTPGSV